MRLSWSSCAQQVLKDILCSEELLEGFFWIGCESVLAQESPILQHSFLQLLLAVPVVDTAFFGWVNGDVPSCSTSNASAACEKRW
jgi:hypothetical protein